MASKVIKGLTVEIGGDTTKLGKALENVENKSRNLSRELGEVNRLLKMDPGNADLLAQKQQILAEAVENTKDKLHTLKEAEAQVQAQFERGEVSVEQVRALQREIAATEQKLKGYERAVDETAEEVSRLGNAADDAADHIDDTADAADEAEDATEELGSSLDGTLTNGFKAVAVAAAAATAAIVGCVEASHEYRTEMGKLDTAFTTNGHTAEAAYETYSELQGVLGETEQAVEAANHLAVLTESEEDLAKWTEICTGVYATFGASLPIEGLTEAANETAKVGQVTGPLADALNWAGVAEDAFNESLEACTDEQERQALITETLNDLYGDAATAYRKTNKQVIEANEANERWNNSVAKLGENLAPVVTEVKNFGAEMLGNMAEPMEDVADFISTELLPRLLAITNWVRSNGPTVKAVLVGVTAALVAYKVATIAAEVAQKGLRGAILATTAAEKALQLVQAATPWGLAAVAIGGVVAGLYTYLQAVEDAKPAVELLTEAEQDQIKAAREAAEAWEQNTKAVTDAEAGILSQMDYTKKLAKELDELVGAHGRVADADEARVNFILNELNNALGTEMQLVDGVVQDYDDLKRKIYDVIAAKQANMLLEANSGAYVEAIQAQTEAWQALTNTERDYTNTLGELTAKEAEYAAERRAYDDWVREGHAFNNTWEAEERVKRLAALEEEVEAEKLTLQDKKAAYDQAAEDYGQYSQLIRDYESAQTAVLEENYDKAVDILTDKGQAFEEFAGEVDEETARVLATLKQEAIDAGLAAEDTKQKFREGVDGYTEEMVKEAEEGYADALEEFSTAYADATGVGEDIGEGLTEGMEKKRWSAISKVKSIVSNIISAARKEADSHSPSRKMIAFGEDMTEGAEVGMENRTKNLLDTARKQVSGLVSAYADAGEDVGQTAFTNISRQTATREAQAYQTAMTGNADKLDKILAAIERGQILTIDGKQLVGHTAGLYDNELGRRRALAARGAM